MKGMAEKHVEWESNIARKVRNATIEECARVADRYPSFDASKIAAAIRALKDKP